MADESDNGRTREGSESEAGVPERRVEVRDLVTLFVWAVVVALFFHFFESFRLLFLGILAAGCLAAALYPLVRYFPASRALSAVLVGVMPVVLVVGLIVLMSWLLASPIKQEVQRWPEVQEKMNNALARWSQQLGMEEPVDVQTLLGGARGFLGTPDGMQVLSTITGVAVALVLTFFGSIYLMAEPPGRLLTPAVDAMPRRRARQVRAAFDDLVPRLRWWLIGTLFSMTVVGVAAWIGYALVGLDFALPLAVLAGVAEIVPNVGPAAAFLVAALVASTQGMGTLVAVVVIYVIIQVVESYVLVPLVMKKAVEEPPIVTLFTVVLWGTVFGAPGLFLAIPINLTLWSFFDHLVLRPRREQREQREQPAPS